MTKAQALKLLSMYDADLVIQAIKRIQKEAEETKQEQIRRSSIGTEISI